ncbi:MAG: class I SAM-dependent methyltransferase [Candidatus Omnitrophica bacterium]|nr:class I SAM-dependent methyltransferase [Candidatus Omnitrophota bacterium]
MNREKETERLNEVYQGYSRSKHVQEKWRHNSKGNQFIGARRDETIEGILKEKHYFPLEDRKILDIGCGNGDVLAHFLNWGAQAKNLYGADLISERIDEAKRHYPSFELRCVNAEKLDFPDNFFDLILIFTVFSSILDESMAHGLAKEAMRVLKNGGLVLVYDVRYSNIFNPHTRRITKKDIINYFPGCDFKCVPLTLIPQLARFFAPLSYTVCRVLEKIPFLRSHYLTILQK